MKILNFPPTVSYWEIKEYLKGVDLLVIGSGIVGLTTAIFYKKRFPEKRVLIAEKGILPSGASTKNAGFACFGSASEILADLESHSEQEVYDLIEKRLVGLQELRSLVGDKNLEYSACGGFEIFRPEDESLYKLALEFIPEANKQLDAKLGLKNTYAPMDSKIKEFGFSGIEHLLLNQHEGSIDTGKMMNSLLSIAYEHEVIILNGLELIDFNDNAGFVDAQFKNGLCLKTKKLHVANNGFATRILPDLDIKPARAQVLITSEIESLKVKGTFHMKEGFYYFRNVGNRILFGGGRELDIAGETNDSLEVTEQIQQKLDELLRETILPSTNYQVEHRWAGVMGVGQSKKTIVKQLSERVSCAVRLGGMGVAIGASIGKESAELISNKNGD